MVFTRTQADCAPLGQEALRVPSVLYCAGGDFVCAGPGGVTGVLQCSGVGQGGVVTYTVGGVAGGEGPVGTCAAPGSARPNPSPSTSVINYTRGSGVFCS